MKNFKIDFESVVGGGSILDKEDFTKIFTGEIDEDLITKINKVVIRLHLNKQTMNELKEWSEQNKISIEDILIEGFNLLKSKKS